MCQSGPHLPGPDKESPGPFKIRGFTSATRDGYIEFFSRKRSQTNRFNKLFLLISQDSKEIHNLAVNIVVGFNRRWFSIEEYRGGSRERLAVVMSFWKKRKQLVQVAEFPTIPAEADLLSLRKVRDGRGLNAVESDNRRDRSAHAIIPPLGFEGNQSLPTMGDCNGASQEGNNHYLSLLGYEPNKLRGDATVALLNTKPTRPIKESPSGIYGYESEPLGEHPGHYFASRFSKVSEPVTLEREA